MIKHISISFLTVLLTLAAVAVLTTALALIHHLFRYQLEPPEMFGWGIYIYLGGVMAVMAFFPGLFAGATVFVTNHEKRHVAKIVILTAVLCSILLEIFTIAFPREQTWAVGVITIASAILCIIVIKKTNHPKEAQP